VTASRVQWGTCASGLFGSPLGETIVAQPMTSVDLGAFAPGTYCVRVFARIGSVESGPSTVAQKTVSQPIPNPPTLVTVSGLAYEFSGNKRSTMVVGNVALGTSCILPVRSTTADGTQYYQVASSSITFVDGYKRKGNTFVVACA
jgi:hypothetical protein